MVKVRQRGAQIRQFILKEVGDHPSDIAKRVADRFGITRQAAGRHLQHLVDERALVVTGQTRNIRYALRPLEEWRREYRLSPELAEDVIWRNDVAPVLGRLPANVLAIWEYGFTEMFNNAIDHSEGTTVTLDLKKTAADSELFINDDGIGIFRKIQSRMDLLDERHAVLELAKGKLTTDPARHTGEGIFFTSRMFDDFGILSGETYFSHQFGDDRDWILQNKREGTGTLVWMKLHNHTPRTLKRVFSEYSSGDELGFTKTVVPVRLAQYGAEGLVSRSQAKRLLARVDRFGAVVFDFKEVDAIGQAFADEIFRVFARQHPEIALYEINASDEVKAMIARAKANALAELAVGGAAPNPR